MKSAGSYRYGLLGRVQVMADGVPVPISSRRQRLLLAALLLRAGNSATSDSLCELLWEDAQPDHPHAALRSQISRLRRSLGPQADLSSGDHGYRLGVARDAVDTGRFEDLVTLAAQAPPAAALALLEEALGLWRGPAVTDFADHPWIQPAAVRLDERRVAARERRAELLLRLGRVTDALAALRELVVEHPEHERGRGLLMEALYRAGRQTNALAEYQAWRHLLAEERGLEPSPFLQRLEADILAHRLSGGDDGPSTQPDPAPPAAVPRPTTSFLGRQDDIAAVVARLEAGRLLTLTGPGGVGKTRLALEAGARVTARYGDGILFCDLAAIDRDAEVTRTIARALGLRERAHGSLDEQLIECLAGRRILLLLDNCEHVLASVATTVSRITRLTATVDVLATSRERLAVDGETVWAVEPLPVTGDASAVELFIARARSVTRRFEASPPARAVIREICTRLDGLPLAIEMAAARTAALSLEDLAEGLGHRFELLDRGRRDHGRHRSLRAVVQWSYAQLEPGEQQLFGRLCVFTGGFDLPAARAVAGPIGETASFADAVARLVERSLVTCHDPCRAAPYRLLDTLRSYGIERLHEAGELPAARERHARWAMQIADQAASGLASGHEGRWVRLLDRHFDDLRAAHLWLVAHDVEGALRLADALHPYGLWHARSEVFRWAEAAAGAASSNPLLPGVLASVCAGAWMRSDLGAADAAVQAARAEVDDPQAPAARRVVEQLGELALLRGDAERAHALFVLAHEQSLVVGDLLQATWDVGSAALALCYAGRSREGQPLAAQAAALANRTGSPSARAFAHFVAGELAAGSESPAAHDHLCDAVALAESVGNQFLAGMAEVTLATLASRHDDQEAALHRFQSVMTTWQQTGVWTTQWVTLRNLVHFLVRRGALEDAAILYGAVISAATAAPPYGADERLLREVGAHLAEHMAPDDLDRRIGEGQRLNPKEVTAVALAALASLA